MNMMTNSAAMLVRDSGSRMSKKKRMGPAPSMRAASASSSGTVRKNWRKRNVAVADAISGSVRPQYVFTIPRLATTWYVGMMRTSTRSISVAQREPEVHDRERRQHRDRDLPDGDRERHDQAVPHHVPDRRLRPGGAAA